MHFWWWSVCSIDGGAVCQAQGGKLVRERRCARGTWLMSHWRNKDDVVCSKSVEPFIEEASHMQLVIAIAKAQQKQQRRLACAKRADSFES